MAKQKCGTKGCKQEVKFGWSTGNGTLSLCKECRDRLMQWFFGDLEDVLQKDELIDLIDEERGYNDNDE